jgi:hypothetical protein
MTLVARHFFDFLLLVMNAASSLLNDRTDKESADKRHKKKLRLCSNFNCVGKKGFDLPVNQSIDRYLSAIDYYYSTKRLAASPTMWNVLPRVGFITTGTAARPFLRQSLQPQTPFRSRRNAVMMYAPLSAATASWSHRSTLISRVSVSTFTTAINAGASTTTTALHMSSLFDNPIQLYGSIVTLISFIAFFKYRDAIQRQLRRLRQDSWLFGAVVRMERTTERSNDSIFQRLQFLQLDSDFQEQYAQHKFVSLGDYMASLRPKGLPQKLTVRDLPDVIQTEIEAGLVAALLRSLGPKLGRAFLPAVGTQFVQGLAKQFANIVTGRWLLAADAGVGESGDKAGLPVSLMTLLTIADTSAKWNSFKEEEDEEKPIQRNKDGEVGSEYADLTAIDKMRLGEVVRSCSFVDKESGDNIPNTFVLDRDFERAILAMEARLRGEKGCEQARANGGTVVQTDESKPNLSCADYDPNDRRLQEPKPVNKRLFPDLYIGYGDALCTHTKQEVLKMRLLSILLNRLGSNYFKKQTTTGTSDDDTGTFVVKLTNDGSDITTPADFIQALIDSGNTVEMVPTSRLTTFGIGLCIKNDDSWSNVPLGVFIESGYEDKEGNMAPAQLPHSGIDLYITGPLTGTRADGTPCELSVQHFIGIEGFCGWHSNADVEIPYNEPVPSGPRISGEEAVRAARLAALLAMVLNGSATELNLPFGGYGVTAVCNDSAAILQLCLYGENTIYPMTAIGLFNMRYVVFSSQRACPGACPGNVNLTESFILVHC